MVPKHIDKKIDRLNTLLERAYTIKSEITSWIEKQGGDTADMEWCENVIDECSTMNGICKDSFYEYIQNVQKK